MLPPKIMAEFFKREFKAHPIQALVALMTGLSFTCGAIVIAWTGVAKATHIQRDVAEIKEDLEDHVGHPVHPADHFMPKAEQHAINEEREKRFEAKAEEIEKDINEIKAMQMEQRQLSRDILKRLSTQ